jgi:hypothetical protein
MSCPDLLSAVEPRDSEACAFGKCRCSDRSRRIFGCCRCQNCLDALKFQTLELVSQHDSSSGRGSRLGFNKNDVVFVVFRILRTASSHWPVASGK